jgi:hypothetical protein
MPFTDVPKNLEILAEECAEVIQIKSKIIRFGIDDYHPKNGAPNRQALETECGHVLAMIEILVKNGLLTQKGIDEAKELKKIKMRAWY